MLSFIGQPLVAVVLFYIFTITHEHYLCKCAMSPFPISQILIFDISLISAIRLIRNCPSNKI